MAAQALLWRVRNLIESTDYRDRQERSLSLWQPRGFHAGGVQGCKSGLGRMVSCRLNGYLNPGAFAPPPIIDDGTGIGNYGVGILRGLDQHNLDLGIQRDFAVTEKSALQSVWNSSISPTRPLGKVRHWSWNCISSGSL